ncbi:MAG: hypothetical protein EA420_19240 [Candidatus Competibacteraceae bacterium]|nr:MAG: hypothetical protein EA420_19240 [Candidatus Competibacteraceae bacterium]
MAHGLSKSRLQAFRQCPKRLWLAVHRSDLQEISLETEQRLQIGFQVGDITRTLHPDGVSIDTPDPREALALTRRALAAHPDRPLFEAAFGPAVARSGGTRDYRRAAHSSRLSPDIQARPGGAGDPVGRGRTRSGGGCGTMLTLAYTMHQGKLCRQQQDCILIDGAIHQDRVLPIAAWSSMADEVLLAVADGVASSGGNRRIAPQQASRIVLEELVKAVREHPEWLQDGFVANRHVRHVQAQLSDKLADNPKTYGAASTLAVAHVRSGRAAVLNVGDSRVYQANREGQWRRLSKDHTVLQGMIDRGEASPAIEFKHTLDVRQVASDRSLVTYGAASILAVAHVWDQCSAILNSNDLRVYVDG